MNDPNQTRFLITRLSHIGDCVLTLPLVCAIKREYPDAQIAWAMESPTHKLLKDHPCIDEIILVPKGWLKKPSAWKSLKAQFRAFAPDVVIDPQSLTKSSLLGRISGAKCRIGFDAPYGRELSSLFNTAFIKTEQSHLVDRTMDFCGHERINVSDRTIEFRLPIGIEDLRAMEDWTQQEGCQQYLVMNPGASWASKRWVTKRFGYVARYAERAFGIPTVVTWSGDSELAMAERIVEQSGDCAVIAPETSLGELAALCRGSRAFIGCDTGPLHIAAATGTQCVGLYGPTLPENSGAYGEQHIAIQRWHQNGRKRKRAANLAMRDISVDEVCSAVDQLQLMPQQQNVLKSAA